MIRLLLIFALALFGCAGSQVNPQAQTATAVAMTANAALPVLIQVYRSEGLEAIHDATDRATAERHLAEIDATWDPKWKAWNALAKAEDDWARVIESEGDTTKTLAAVRKAYCDLLVVWPRNVPIKPISVFTCGLP